MQRAGLESILGLRMRGAFLHLDPCIPRVWGNFQMTVRYRSARYEIFVENPDGVSRGVLSARLDGTEIVEWPLRLPMLDDGVVHRVQLRLGRRPRRPRPRG
jgi:cyclic beta-1,2-glucan synthetase